MDQTPEHRSQVQARSGDTHVIGADGQAVNVDALAREKAAADAAQAEAAPPRARKPAETTETAD